MNPGPVEEAGLTARTIVESFKSAPSMLALVVFNLAFLVVVAYMSHSNHDRWDKESARWKEVVELTLKTCQVPQKEAGAASGAADTTSLFDLRSTEL